jgi:hypothetical protein
MATSFKKLTSEGTKPTVAIQTGTPTVSNEKAGLGVDASGMPALYDTSGNNILSGLGESGNVPILVKLGTVTGATSTGIKLSVANPAGATLLVVGLLFDITTVSTNANTVDIGVAADGTTSSDTLIDGASTASTALVRNSMKDAGTNGRSVVKWTSTQFINVNANTDATGLVADLYAWVCKVPS